jgi:seryl-tRNA synthetase
LLSIDLIRQRPDLVRQSLVDRAESDSIDDVVMMDASLRQLIHKGDELRAHRNDVSRNLAQMTTKPAKLIQEMREVGNQIKILEQQVKELGLSLQDMLLSLPNIPSDDVPVGVGEEDNVVVRAWGEAPTFDFVPMPHWDLGERLGIIDFRRGVKLSGTRFYTLCGVGASLERALINWMIDVHVQDHGYLEVSLPYLVKRATMVASGNLPKFADNLYHDDEDDLWLIPTAEVPITSLHADEVLSVDSLPIYYVAYTACFRREKAAAGKDTRGIKRVNQFNKVEMYKIVTADQSDFELEKLLADAEDICQRLGLPYRVVRLCTAELGFASSKSYDIDLWAPGCQEWLEVSSCSNCTDFQARRANVRYRFEHGAPLVLPHTLNGSGLALPRLLIAILETYQRSDGSVTVPEVLRPYVHMDTILA